MRPITRRNSCFFMNPSSRSCCTECAAPFLGPPYTANNTDHIFKYSQNYRLCVGGLEGSMLSFKDLVLLVLQVHEIISSICRRKLVSEDEFCGSYSYLYSYLILILAGVTLPTIVEGENPSTHRFGNFMFIFKITKD